MSLLVQTTSASQAGQTGADDGDMHDASSLKRRPLPAVLVQMKMPLKTALFGQAVTAW
jgi:hypothetical protein